MDAAVSPAMPPTLTPVHDAANRWAAMRLNLAAPGGPDAGMFEFLYGTGGADPVVGNLPLLIETDDPQTIGRLLDAVTPAAPIYLVVPQQQFLPADVKAVFSQLESRGVFALADGLPEGDGWAHGVAVDCANGVPAEAAKALHRYKGPRMASAVGSRAGHRDCVRAGFQWFEGGWAIQPEKDIAHQPVTSRTLLLNLLGLVASDADSRSIEDLLKWDPNLSYQLLKLVNSVSFSLTHKISSFGQAITLLGRRQLQRWLQLLLYAGHHADGAISPLLGRAAMRAALMEVLVETAGGKQDARDQAFMVGMFSLLDVLFNAPLVELITPLNLDAAVNGALIESEGRLGCQLRAVIAAESAPDEALAQMLAELDLDSETFLHAQVRASTWALQVCRDI